MAIRLTEQLVEDIFSSQPARLDAILRHDNDMFNAVINATGSARRRLDQLFTRSELRRFRERVENPDFIITRSEARAVKRLYQNGVFSGLDSEVVTIIRDSELGLILQSDHLFEQRFVDEMATGNIFFTRRPAARSLGRDPDRAHDVTAIAVPFNEIMYYRLARQADVEGFRLAGLYPHRGPGSKTTRMAQIIPVGSEAAHSINDVVNAHLWVLIKEQGLPISYRRDVLHDIADALDSGIHNNRTLRNQARQEIGSDLTVASIERYLNGLPFPTAETFSPVHWPRHNEIEMPLVL